MGSGSAEKLFKYRLKIGGFNTHRAGRLDRPWCPLKDCGQEEWGHLAHIRWSCGVAQRVWNKALRLWTQPTVSSKHMSEFEGAAFAGSDPAIPHEEEVTGAHARDTTRPPRCSPAGVGNRPTDSTAAALAVEMPRVLRRSANERLRENRSGDEQDRGRA